jgi:hypothetical protein
MVDAVQEKVEEHCPVFIGKVVVYVEEKSVESVFEDCPYEHARCPERNTPS